MTPLDRRSPTPLWSQLRDDLRSRLAAGAFADGFPSEAQLCEDYDVSRNTVREALRRLEDEGLIERERGRGTSVAPGGVEQRLAGLFSLARTLGDQGLREHSTVVVLDRRRAGCAAGPLGIPADEEVVYVERLRFADDQPLALDRSWLPYDVGAPLLGADLTHGSLYDLIERSLGSRPTSGSERIAPVIPTRAERALLRIPDGEAAFLTERLVLSGKTVVELRSSLIRGDRYCFVACWP